jgi:DNA-binding PadR family transcriptional regulator
MRHSDRFGGGGGGGGGCGGDPRHLWFSRLRHGVRGGGGFFSRRGGGFGGGDEDFSRGRKFSSDDLQLLLIALLVDAPRHGYELIKLLEERSNGFYTPSPGMVYPALMYLEEIGYATVLPEGNRKSYSLTAEGRAYLDTNRERVDVIWAKLNFLGKKMGLVRRALAGEEGDDDRGEANPSHELMEARTKLKRELFASSHASREEQLRIAQVLERAVAEIAGKPDKDSKEH